MNRRGEMLCAWSGPVMIAVLLVAWVFIVEWLPPPSPGDTANQTASMYQDHVLGIRTGMMLMMLGGALCASYGAVIMVQMLRMRGPSPALAYTQFGSAVANVIFFIVPNQIWGATAFRPDRAVEITQFGHDLGWIIFDMVTSTTILQFAAIGMATLWDRSAQPVFARWYGYFCLLCATLVISPSFITYFKTGPFAWNGIIGFFVGVAVYTTWDFITFVMLRNAIVNAPHGPAETTQVQIP